jgi:hypothetical protein
MLTLSEGSIRVGASPPPSHMITETDPVLETLCFLLFRIQDDGKSPEPSNFLMLYIVVRTLYEYILHVHTRLQTDGQT